jgi:hypothetical protein
MRMSRERKLPCNDEVELLGAQLRYQLAEAAAEHVRFVDVGVGFEQAAVSGLGGEVHFGSRELGFQLPHNRRCQHDIANGREAQNEDFQGRLKIRGKHF